MGGLPARNFDFGVSFFKGIIFASAIELPYPIAVGCLTLPVCAALLEGLLEAPPPSTIDAYRAEYIVFTASAFELHLVSLSFYSNVYKLFKNFICR